MLEVLNPLLFNAFVVCVTHSRHSEKGEPGIKQDWWDQTRKIIRHSKTMIKAKTEKTQRHRTQFKGPYCVKSMVHSVQCLLSDSCIRVSFVVKLVIHSLILSSKG